MIALSLQTKTVPEDMAREIYKKSQGNPFLTEEIVYACRDSGKITVGKNGQLIVAADFTNTGNIRVLVTPKYTRNQKINYTETL